MIVGAPSPKGRRNAVLFARVTGAGSPGTKPRSMRFSTARFLSLVTLVSGLALFAFVPGCSQQSEGERCGDDAFGTTGSDDCGDGLVCTLRTKLVNEGDGANRCCNPERVTDSRCQPFTGTAVGGSGGGAGTSTSGGSAGTTSGGGDTAAEAGLGGEGG